MSKRFFNFMAIVSSLAYLETSYIHYLGSQELYGPLSNVAFTLLFLPFVAVIGLIFDALEKVSKRNAIIVKVEKNSLNAYTLDNTHSAFVLGDFSDSMHFIANAKTLEENFNALLRKHAANTTKLMPAPFVIIKASLTLVSEIEQDCLVKSAERAGAIKAVVIDTGASDEVLQSAIESNSSNFMWS
jgi:hypothetical protein